MLPPPDLQTAFLMAVDRLAAIVPALVGPTTAPPSPQSSGPEPVPGRTIDRGLLRVVRGLSVATSLVVVLGAWALHERLGEHSSAARTNALRDAMLNQLGPAQIAGGRALITHLVKDYGFTHVLAHRQGGPGREICPGPDVWREVGAWGVEKHGLQWGGPEFSVAGGSPIPATWWSLPGIA
jgi:hypothetical protein